MSTTDSITLRRANGADAPAIAAVFDAAVGAGWSYLGDAVRSPMFTSADWDELVAEHQPPNVLLVAVADDRAVVAFAAAHPRDGELFLLFVDPVHAGRGIARLLLDAVHDEMRAAGRREAHLFTHEQNERALAMYARAGYRPDGSVRTSEFRGIALREPRLVKPI